MWILGFSVSFLLLLYVYIKHNDKRLTSIPPEALSFSPKRFTEEDARSAEKQFAGKSVSVKEQLPPSTGRRYIVVGGAGFVGGWIVLHLLQRGEDPRKIRILDIRPPSRPDIISEAKGVDFIKVDISDTASVDAAFKQPWPPTSDSTAPEITIFHTAANIRFYERHPALLPRSTNVNVNGTQNIVDAARAIGATVLIQTSSGSVGVRSNRFFLWPWETAPKCFVQILNDDDTLLPKYHEDFFSNYAASKIIAERIVRKANGSPSGKGVLRTGSIRPGNGVFGPGGDILCGAYLVRKQNPSWIHNIMNHFVYVENASLSHLLYEQRLIEISQGSFHPDISGQAFVISDPGAPMTFGDVYTVLETLDGETVFPALSPTGMLLVAQIIEWIYLTQYFLSTSSLFILRLLSRALLVIKGDIVNLQPALFNLTMIHLLFDDSRARLSPEKGGLGYTGAYTTLQGLCKTVEEHKKSGGKGEERSLSGGISFEWGRVRAERAAEEVGKGLGVAKVVG